MAPVDIDTALAWQGRTVLDRDGDKIGSFGDVFLDRHTDLPAWGGVRTGLFGRHESYVPLAGVEEVDDDHLRVPFAAEQVKDAPRIDPEVALSAEEEEALYGHYGVPYSEAGAAGSELPGDDHGAEVVRSEEEPVAAPGPMQPTERVRLKKVLVTEHVKKVVPVQREVVEVVEDPPAGDEPPAR